MIQDSLKSENCPRTLGPKIFLGGSGAQEKARFQSGKHDQAFKSMDSGEMTKLLVQQGAKYCFQLKLWSHLTCSAPPGFFLIFYSCFKFFCIYF